MISLHRHEHFIIFEWDYLCFCFLWDSFRWDGVSSPTSLKGLVSLGDF